MFCKENRIIRIPKWFNALAGDQRTFGLLLNYFWGHGQGKPNLSKILLNSVSINGCGMMRYYIANMESILPTDSLTLYIGTNVNRR